ncbi:hypothetical protein TNCV_2020471 [Trichonephila clavipes]|nr:hypothetical protein TNCV_2020471 [Trichonephila clavipes]
MSPVFIDDALFPIWCEHGHIEHLEELNALKNHRSPPAGSTAYQLLPRSINHQVANVVTKNDAKLALSPTFLYVSFKSPLQYHLFPMFLNLFLGNRDVFQDANAPIHKFRSVQTWLQEHDDEVGNIMWWP